MCDASSIFPLPFDQNKFCYYVVTVNIVLHAASIGMATPLIISDANRVNALNLAFSNPCLRIRLSNQ